MKQGSLLQSKPRKSQNSSLVHSLQEAVESLRIKNADRLRELTTLLEAQLTEHVEMTGTERQNDLLEVEALRQMLTESQAQLEPVKTGTSQTKGIQGLPGHGSGAETM